MTLRNDTIVAHATGGTRSAIAIIRMSGPETRFVLETIAGKVPQPRRLSRRHLADPASGAALDDALVTWFPAPASFSGEDMAELHVHGGLAVLQATLRTLCSFPKVRLAEPGEFTRRAVLNGKLDLTAAEALGDLVEAETEAQRSQALRQLDGAMGSAVAAWREILLDALAMIEADLDFSDEGDVGEGLVETAIARLEPLLAPLDAALAERGGERLRSGFTTVIAGPPNAGKSSLLNHLARRDVAIVSPHAGTTRDALEVHCDLGGFPVVLVDTAGLRSASDPIEAMGVARAEDRIGRADLVVWLEPADATGRSAPPAGTPDILRIETKSDLRHRAAGDALLSVSVVTGEGIDALIAELGRRAAAAMDGSALITRERHRSALLETRAALAAALSPNKPTALIAEEVRGALRALGTITGHVGAEDVLDRIFASFCIGK